MSIPQMHKFCHNYKLSGVVLLCVFFCLLCCLYSTFKKQCPAVFTLSAKRGEDQFLSVVKKPDGHNHCLDPAAYPLYPSVRRLDPTERQQQVDLVRLLHSNCLHYDRLNYAEHVHLTFFANLLYRDYLT